MPPETVGGRKLALTCGPCNHTAGTLLDAPAAHREAQHDFLAGRAPDVPYVPSSRSAPSPSGAMSAASTTPSCCSPYPSWQLRQQPCSRRWRCSTRARRQTVASCSSCKNRMSRAVWRSCSAATRCSCRGWRTRNRLRTWPPRSSGFLCCRHHHQSPRGSGSLGRASTSPGRPSRCTPRPVAAARNNTVRTRCRETGRSIRAAWTTLDETSGGPRHLNGHLNCEFVGGASSGSQHRGHFEGEFHLVVRIVGNCVIVGHRGA